MGEEAGASCWVRHLYRGKWVNCTLDPLHDGDHQVEVGADVTILWPWTKGQRQREETRWLQEEF